MLNSRSPMGLKFSCNKDFCQLLQKDFANMKEK